MQLVIKLTQLPKCIKLPHRWAINRWFSNNLMADCMKFQYNSLMKSKNFIYYFLSKFYGLFVVNATSEIVVKFWTKNESLKFLN